MLINVLVEMLKFKLAPSATILVQYAQGLMHFLPVVYLVPLQSLGFFSTVHVHATPDSMTMELSRVLLVAIPARHVL